VWRFWPCVGAADYSRRGARERERSAPTLDDGKRLTPSAWRWRHAAQQRLELVDLFLQFVADRALQKARYVRVDVRILVAEGADGDGNRGLKLLELTHHPGQLGPKAL